MKKWLTEFLNKVRFEKSRRSDIYIEQIARDRKGRWVTDNEKKLVYKNDDPKRIKKFTDAQDCGEDCGCKQSSIKIRTTDGVKKASGKPVAKKKPTGGGTKKEQAIE
jgi:hypothetical protein